MKERIYYRKSTFVNFCGCYKCTWHPDSSDRHSTYYYSYGFAIAFSRLKHEGQNWRTTVGSFPPFHLDRSLLFHLAYLNLRPRYLKSHYFSRLTESRNYGQSNNLSDNIDRWPLCEILTHTTTIADWSCSSRPHISQPTAVLLLLRLEKKIAEIINEMH